MQFKYLIVCIFLLPLLACHSDAPPVRNMASIMDSITRENQTKDNNFSSAGKLTYVTAMLADPTNSNHMVETNYYKASALLESGQEKDALSLFGRILREFRPPTPQVYQQMLKTYAVAALRQGEKENCIIGHTTASCIMPVAGNGVHRIKDGSAEAIRVYKTLLEMDTTDLDSRWLMNIAYMTLGEYPSGVPKQWLIPDLDKDFSKHPVKPFKDIAPQLRLDPRNRAGGMIVDDFNNDGLMDVVTSDWAAGTPMHFFKNNGNGGFSDISASSGIGKCTGGLNIVQADYNNDGFTDILVLRGGWMLGRFGKQPNSLLRNNGDNTFTDVTIEAGLFSQHPTQTAVWRDFNNDGWLDLFIGNETTQPDDPNPCELFISDQHGGFKDVASEAGCNLVYFVKGVTSADYDNDGLADIFLSTSSGRRILLKNTGSTNNIPHFEDVTQAAGINTVYGNSFPTWFFDYDNDGWQDIFVSGYQPAQGKTMAYTIAAEAMNRPEYSAGRLYLFHNNHDGTFTNVSKETGLDHCVFSMGSNFGDIDNDGYLDMYLGTGNPEFGSLVPNKMFRNIDGKMFEDVTVSSKTGNLQKGHGVAFSDIDNDGDQDIFAETGGAYDGDAYYSSLYLNPGQNDNHWIYIDCVGKKCNRSAIGSRIQIKFTENGRQRTLYRDVNSGGSFGSSPLRREIGIGQANMIDELTITWAGSKQSQTFRNITPNQCIKITEGKENPDKVILKKLDLQSGNSDLLPCVPVSRETVRR